MGAMTEGRADDRAGERMEGEWMEGLMEEKM